MTFVLKDTRDYLKRKKLTNKERDEAIGVLNNNLQYLLNKMLSIDNLLGLYLEYRKDTVDFEKFVKARAEEFEKQKRSGDKKGA